MGTRASGPRVLPRARVAVFGFLVGLFFLGCQSETPETKVSPAVAEAARSFSGAPDPVEVQALFDRAFATWKLQPTEQLYGQHAEQLTRLREEHEIAETKLLDCAARSQVQTETMPLEKLYGVCATLLKRSQGSGADGGATRADVVREGS